MRLPSVPTLPVVEHLNTSYFHRVWNAPNDHGRANFQLSKAAQRLQIGAVFVNNQSVVGLPATDTVYAVYRASIQVFGRFITFKQNTWITDADILKQYGVSIITYSAGGRVIPTGVVHLRYDPLRSTVLVAIERAFMVGCLGTSFPDLYMTVNFDTTRNTPVVASLYQVSNAFGKVVTTQSVVTAIATAKANCPVGTVVYVNGWLYTPETVPPLVVGDIVQIVSDPDIVGYCDLSVDDNVTGYYSDLYGEYREVLHIPKALNPNNYIITTDTLSVAVVDITTNRGVYGHRIDPHAVESVTHNDFSMSRNNLQAFQNTLESQGVFVRLYVRLPTDPQPLETEVNHLDDLYTLSDQEIKDQLAGLSGHQIKEWKASHLEASAYLSLLYKFTGFTSEKVLENYTSAMGYYDVASTLSQAAHYYTFKGAEVEIKKPARLIGFTCDVIVYADGRKLPEGVAILHDVSGTAFTLGFKAGSYVKLGSKMCVYVIEHGLRLPEAFNPTLDAPSITVASDDYSLVKIVTYPNPKPVWGGTATKGYHYIPVSPADYTVVVNPNGTATFKAKAPQYGNNFYLVPSYGFQTIVYPLDDILAQKKPIIVPLQVRDATSTLIPLIAYQTVEVYINGYRLTDGLDYTCTPVIGDYDDTIQTLLEVTNQTYIDVNGTGNVMEIVVHSDTVASVDKGYVISNMMNRSIPPMIWSKSCGRAFANGLLQRNVTEIGDTVISADPIPDGAPYLLEWSIPYSVRKLMVNLSPNSDIDLRTRIFHVLGLTVPSYPDTVQITRLHALYSPYLAQIVYDVAAGNFAIHHEIEDDRFLQQFSAYAIILKRDPILTTNPLIDRRFVSLAAHYANLNVTDPQQMLLVQRLINLVLSPSFLSINEVLL